MALFVFDGCHLTRTLKHRPPQRVTKISNRVIVAWLLGYSLKLFSGNSGIPRDACVYGCARVACVTCARVCVSRVRVRACVRTCVSVRGCVRVRLCAPMGIRRHTHTRLWVYAGTRPCVSACIHGGGGACVYVCIPVVSARIQKKHKIGKRYALCLYL